MYIIFIYFDRGRPGALVTKTKLRLFRAKKTSSVTRLSAQDAAARTPQPLFYSSLFSDNNGSQFYKWLFDNFSNDERIK